MTILRLQLQEVSSGFSRRYGPGVMIRATGIYKPSGRKEISMDEKMEKALKSLCEKLTDEQKEKAKSCKSVDEFMKLLGEWGVELSDETLDAISGGIDFYHRFPTYF